MSHHTLRRPAPAIAALAAFLSFAAPPRPALAQAAVQPDATAARARLQREYAESFRGLGLVPILLPRGHTPGDVLAAGGELLSSSTDCFTGLVSRDEPSRLDAVEVSWGAAAQLALGADEVATASAKGNAEDLVALRFEGARAHTASRYQLRQAVRAEACPEVARALAESAAPGPAQWLLIGEVIVARPTARVRRSHDAGAQANLSFLQSLGQRFGLRVRAEGGGELRKAETAEVAVAEPVPVAFRPAMVLVTPEIAERYRGPAPSRPTLEAFNPRDEAHRAALDLWLDRYLNAAAAAH